MGTGLRVLFAHNYYLVRGGEDESFEAEVALLRKFGVEVDIYTESNKSVAQLGRGRTAIRTLWSSKDYRKISHILKNEQYNVLHVQNSFPLISPSIYHAAHACGVPVVETTGNFRMACLNGFLFRDGQPCEKCLGAPFPWHGVRHKCYRGSYFGSLTVATMLTSHKLIGTWQNKIDVYVPRTDIGRSKLLAQGIPEWKIEIKPPVLHADLGRGDGGGRFFLFVGRLSPEKGVSSLLTAWSNYRGNYSLKIVGSGPLEDQVTSASAVDPRIEFLGRKPREEVVDLMGYAEALIFSSQWLEGGIPLVIVEALSRGTPVLTSSIGAGAAAIRNGEVGWHFTPGDPDSLVAELAKVENMGPAIAEFRACARSAYERDFSEEANFRRLCEIYKKAQCNFSAKQH